MSVVITEHNVIDIFQDSKIVFTNKNKSDVIENFLGDVFSEYGLKISEFDSLPYKAIKQRCVRIIDKVKANNKYKRPKYYGFSDPEKTFFSETEFPKLCKKDVVQKR